MVSKVQIGEGAVVNKKETAALVPVTETKVHTVRTHRIELSGAKILTALGITHDKVAVYFRVPGGGDWSNTAIEIDSENPIVVTWKEEEDT